MLTLTQVVEINFIDLVDYLTHQLTGFHVVVSIFKHISDDAAPIALQSCSTKILKNWKQIVVYKSK